MAVAISTPAAMTVEAPQSAIPATEEAVIRESAMAAATMVAMVAATTAETAVVVAIREMAAAIPVTEAAMAVMVAGMAE
jgi:hypothetical protein